MSVAIGIDLGTTNTVVAAVADGMAVTLEDGQGKRLIPSVVHFETSGDVQVGAAAKGSRVTDPKNTIYSVKRFIGRPWSSPEVQEAKDRFGFDLTQGPKESVLVTVRGVNYALPEISAFILRRARKIAEEALGTSVEEAVITVPANFNELQRASTKVAGRLAGLNILRMINEPTAAALAYGQQIKTSSRIAIFDLGGGTFDVTILELSGDVFEVLATAGDTALGGDDIDTAVAAHLADTFAKRTKFDPRTDAQAFGRLRLFAEEMKCELSTSAETTQRIDQVGPKKLTLDVKLTRSELERIASPIVERTMTTTRAALASSHLTTTEIDHVILVGGSTRMPLIAQLVEKQFGRATEQHINPDEVVALGAAIQARALDKNRDKEKITIKRGGRSDAPLSMQRPGMTAAKSAGGPRIPTSPGLAAAVVQGAPSSTARLEAALVGPTPSSNTKIVAEPPRAAAPKPATIQKKPEVKKAAPKPADPTYELELDDAPPESNDFSDIAFDEAPTSVRGATVPEVGDVLSLPRQAPTLSFELERRKSSLPPASLPSGPPRQTSGAAEPPVHAYASVPAPNLSEAPNTREEPSGLSMNFGEEFAAAAQDTSFSSLAEPLGNDRMVAVRDKAPLLVDVTPLSLRVETVGGYSDVLLAANTPVPCERTRVFLTAQDNQTSVIVRVAQGELSRYAENTRLGELELSGIQPGRRGEVKIAVTFGLDADGTLNVKAREERTGKEAKAVMRLLGANTSAEDVAQMMARQANVSVTG